MTQFSMFGWMTYLHASRPASLASRGVVKDLYIHSLWWQLHIPHYRSSDKAIAHRSHVRVPRFINNLGVLKLDVEVLIDRGERADDGQVVLELHRHLKRDGVDDDDSFLLHHTALRRWGARSTRNTRDTISGRDCMHRETCLLPNQRFKVRIEQHAEARRGEGVFWKGMMRVLSWGLKNNPADSAASLVRVTARDADGPLLR